MLRYSGVGPALLILLTLMSAAPAETLYSINWLSDPQPCMPVMESPLRGPIISKYYPECRIDDVETPLSICQRQTAHAAKLNLPWDSGDPILVVGYHVSVIQSSPDAKAIVELGTASEHRGADIFATASGNGTFTAKEWFPAGMGTPSGGHNARIDVYASCGGPGTFAILTTIFYTAQK
jgi:hypothetical protein